MRPFAVEFIMKESLTQKSHWSSYYPAVSKDHAWFTVPMTIFGSKIKKPGIASLSKFAGEDE
jgi:hypothetical protein